MLTVDIVKRFTGFTLHAQFEADSGVTALLGASGCGKSVTLRCVAGILKPDEGFIRLDGRTLFDKKHGVDLPPQQRRIGLLFQNYALFPNMTLRQNIEAGMHAVKDAKERRARALRLMESFQLGHLQNHYPRALSGGQQQRAALCRILASEPEALLLDEPFSALDSHLKWQLEREMSGTLSRFSGTVLLVTHDRGEAYRLSDAVCVMDRGKNEMPVPTETLFRTPRTKTAALLSGCKNIAAMERLDAHSLRAAGWGAVLHTAEDIFGDARYIGVRAHYMRFGAPDEENAVPVTVDTVTPDLFSDIYTCVAAGGGFLRLELTKNAPHAPRAGEQACVILPRDAIMLLE